MLGESGVNRPTLQSMNRVEVIALYLYRIHARARVLALLPRVT
jgi:hypothetical protein